MIKTNEDIWNLIQNKNFDEAEKSIKERMALTNLNPAQISALMYRAYEEGHSAGRYEVCALAMNFLNDIAEAK